jgi:hypothetical protein
LLETTLFVGDTSKPDIHLSVRSGGGRRVTDRQREYAFRTDQEISGETTK